jgi:hypothetical protein
MSDFEDDMMWDDDEYVSDGAWDEDGDGDDGEMGEGVGGGGGG